MDSPYGLHDSLHPLFGATRQSVLVFRTIRLVGHFLISVLLLAIAVKASRAFGIALRLREWVFVPIVGQVGTSRIGSFLLRNLG